MANLKRAVRRRGFWQFLSMRICERFLFSAVPPGRKFFVAVPGTPSLANFRLSLPGHFSAEFGVWSAECGRPWRRGSATYGGGDLFWWFFRGFTRALTLRAFSPFGGQIFGLICDDKKWCFVVDKAFAGCESGREAWGVGLQAGRRRRRPSPRSRSFFDNLIG